MDAVSTVQALHSLAWFVRKRLESLNGKCKTKEPTLIALSDAVSRICAVVVQIQGLPNLEGTVMEMCLDLGELLCRVHEHLVVWDDKNQKALGRAVTFLVPFRVTNLLKEDERDLMLHLLLLLFMLKVGAYRGHAPLSAKDNRDFLFGSMQNKEIATLWREYVSDEVCATSVHPYDHKENNDPPRCFWSPTPNSAKG